MTCPSKMTGGHPRAVSADAPGVNKLDGVWSWRRGSELLRQRFCLGSCRQGSDAPCQRMLGGGLKFGHPVCPAQGVRFFLSARFLRGSLLLRFAKYTNNCSVFCFTRRVDIVAHATTERLKRQGAKLCNPLLPGRSKQRATIKEMRKNAQIKQAYHKQQLDLETKFQP